MRNIKFRAWDIHQNKMITKFMIGSITDPDNNEWTCPVVWMNSDWVNHDGLIIMQFTGLQDVDSVDIYEHDIVGFGDDSPSCSTGLYGELGTVFYCEDTCSFKVRLFSTLREVALDDHNMFSSGETCRKVYGNSHEHVELTENISV